MGNKKYDYSAGNVLILFFRMPVETEIVEASPDKPFLAAGVRIDLGRLADVLLRIDRIDGAATKPVSTDPSGIISVPLNDNLLDPTLRLFEQQRGQIQRISKAVEYIQQNLDQPVSVEKLAAMVHMSRTSFYENFREVMQVA